MSQEIKNRCDLCKEIIPHDESIYTVGIVTSVRKEGSVQRMNIPKIPETVKANPGKSLESCGKCMADRFQLIPQEKDTKDTLPPAPSIEDMMYDIAQEAVENFQN